jgi:hypothetical protein
MYKLDNARKESVTASFLFTDYNNQILICLPLPYICNTFAEYHTFRSSFINNVIFIFYEREHKRNSHHSRPSFRETWCLHQQWFTESHKHLYVLFAFRTQDEPMKRDKCIGLLEVWKLHHSSLNGSRGRQFPRRHDAQTGFGAHLVPGFLTLDVRLT